MAKILLATSHAEPHFVGDPAKICINMFVEQNPDDPARVFKLVPRPGMARPMHFGPSKVYGWGQSPAFANGEGLIVASDGAYLWDGVTEARSIDGRRYSAFGGRSQVAFSETQAAILSGGQLSTSDGASVTPASEDWSTLLTDHNATHFSSIGVTGQRLWSTYGSRLAWSNLLDLGETSALNFATAESVPDQLVAGVGLGELIYLFGTQSVETWAQTGDADAPFAVIPGRTLSRGAKSTVGITRAGEAIAFIANDNTVRLITGGVASVISPQWVNRLIEQHTANSRLIDPSPGDVRLGYSEHEGLGQIHLGTNPSLVFRAGKWTVWQTGHACGFDWQHYGRLNSKWYATLPDGSRFAEMQAGSTDDGVRISKEFSAHMPIDGTNVRIGPIRLDASAGGPEADVSMRLSKDGGRSFGAWRTRQLQVQGGYGARVIWRENGLAKPPSLVAHFRVTDEVQFEATGVTAAQSR